MLIFDILPNFWNHQRDKVGNTAILWAWYAGFAECYLQKADYSVKMQLIADTWDRSIEDKMIESSMKYAICMYHLHDNVFIAQVIKKKGRHAQKYTPTPSDTISKYVTTYGGMSLKSRGFHLHILQDDHK